MEKLSERVQAPLTKEIWEWLEEKEKAGLKKAAFARHVLDLYMKAEKEGKVVLLETMKDFWNR